MGISPLPDSVLRQQGNPADISQRRAAERVAEDASRRQADTNLRDSASRNANDSLISERGLTRATTDSALRTSTDTTTNTASVTRGASDTTRGTPIPGQGVETGSLRDVTVGGAPGAAEARTSGSLRFNEYDSERLGLSSQREVEGAIARLSQSLRDNDLSSLRQVGSAPGSLVSVLV